jgi:cytochrome b
MKTVVWDMPTRIFHWFLVIIIATTLIASLTESHLDTHVVMGYAAVGLILFRILWGFSGKRFARFSNFLKGFREVKLYVKRLIAFETQEHYGHNPLVGWMVVCMIAVIFLIALSGTVIYSGEENKGILAELFSFSTAQYAHRLHIFLAYTLISLLVVHLFAALFHQFYLKEKIITTMLTGKQVHNGIIREHDLHEDSGRSVPLLKIIALLLLVIIPGWILLSLTRGEKHEYPVSQAVTIVNETHERSAFIPNETWKSECTDSCHSVLHPTLLPAKSWEKLMSQLENHFGEDASIDTEAQNEIRSFLVTNAAEHSTTEASQKILWFLANDDSPIKITETPYWKRKHSGIAEDVFNRKGIFSPMNCSACHSDAEVGLFEDANIKIPEPNKGGLKL